MPKAGDQADPNGDDPVTSRCAPHDTLRSSAGRWSAAMLAALALLGLAAGCSSSPAAGTAPNPIEPQDRAERDAGFGHRNNVRGSVFDMLGGGTTGNMFLGRGTAGRAGGLGQPPPLASPRSTRSPSSRSPRPTRSPASSRQTGRRRRNRRAERVKVTAFVTDTTLDGGFASRRRVPRGAGWQRTMGHRSGRAQMTPRRIEDAILVRARQIRIAEEEAGRVSPQHGPDWLALIPQAAPG
jgi:hypothetical protein